MSLGKHVDIKCTFVYIVVDTGTVYVHVYYIHIILVSTVVPHVCMYVYMEPDKRCYLVWYCGGTLPCSFVQTSSYIHTVAWSDVRYTYISLGIGSV